MAAKREVVAGAPHISCAGAGCVEAAVHREGDQNLCTSCYERAIEEQRVARWIARGKPELSSAEIVKTRRRLAAMRVVGSGSSAANNLERARRIAADPNAALPAKEWADEYIRAREG